MFTQDLRMSTSPASCTFAAETACDTMTGTGQDCLRKNTAAAAAAAKGMQLLCAVLARFNKQLTRQPLRSTSFTLLLLSSAWHTQIQAQATMRAGQPGP